jgi:predicted ATP-grasp superfamily ATP-dependent carboligase
MSKATPYEVPAIVCDADKLSQIAIIQELGHKGIPVVAVADSPRAIGFASKYVHRRVICPTPSYDPAYIGFLISNLPRGVIFYSNDANTENIARHREDLVAAGFRVFISDPATLERVIQKDRLHQTALECGVRVPKSSLVSSAAEVEAKLSEHGIPAILKSTNLAGGVYRFIASPQAAAAVFQQMRQLLESQPLRHRKAGLMIQQWVPQDGVTLWNFNASVKAGEIVSYSMGRRIRTDTRPDGTLGSILLFGRTEFHSCVLEENQRLLRHLKFDGMVETEWSESAVDGCLHLYDFNPRPSGNIRWTFQSGVSIGEDCYRLALGMPPIPRTMKCGICYAKLIYRTNDLMESLTNANLSLARKLRVAWEDLMVLMGCHRHAVDVLDLKDIGPTLRAAGELASGFWASLRNRMTVHRGNWQSREAKTVSQ